VSARDAAWLAFDARLRFGEDSDQYRDAVRALERAQARELVAGERR
jgi:hypothetical protein